MNKIDLEVQLERQREFPYTVIKTLSLAAFVPLFIFFIAILVSDELIFDFLRRDMILPAKILINVKPGVLNKDDGNGRYPLHVAAEKGHKELVELMLSKGFDVDGRVKKMFEKSFSEGTALMIAADEGREEMVRFLIEKGADPKANDAYGNDALYYGRRSGNKRVVDVLEKVVLKIAENEGS